jgi:hypothetical protein
VVLLVWSLLRSFECWLAVDHKKVQCKRSKIQTQLLVIILETMEEDITHPLPAETARIIIMTAFLAPILLPLFAEVVVTMYPHQGQAMEISNCHHHYHYHPWA